MENLNLKGLSFTEAVTVICWSFFSQHRANNYLYHLNLGLQPKYAFKKASELY